ncbi:MAG: response regulator transcription factor [Spirochaetales bacterium]|nr:response regulator transcription factor [Spirochaetales bacterium]
MSKKTILVVEDDLPILTGLVDLLEGEGYTVVTAQDGNRAVLRYRENKPDLVLLDIMIPEKSGYDVCREIRKDDAATPILMLTAKGQEVDKVVGLELGADDYIVKPFGVQELCARIRASLRRAAGGESEGDVSGDEKPLCFGDVAIEPSTLTGKKGGKEFTVSPREIRLLRLFLSNRDKVLHRFTILDEVWGIRYEGTTRTLDQHIAKLRQKIEDDPSHPRYILTVHTVGYKFSSCP